jgi:hypothetical protein
MFKAGDKVRCLVREFGNEIVGNIYIVDSMIDDFLDLRIKADDFGYPNTYQSVCFELVVEKKTSPKCKYSDWEHS